MAFPVYYDFFKDTLVFICPNCDSITLIPQASIKINSVPFVNILQKLYPDEETFYRFHCWNCQSRITATALTEKDSIPTLGYRCPNCKQTLRELFIRQGLIIT